MRYNLKITFYFSKSCYSSFDLGGSAGLCDPRELSLGADTGHDVGHLAGQAVSALEPAGHPHEGGPRHAGQLHRHRPAVVTLQGEF